MRYKCCHHLCACEKYRLCTPTSRPAESGSAFSQALQVIYMYIKVPVAQPTPHLPKTPYGCPQAFVPVFHSLWSTPAFPLLSLGVDLNA